MSTYRYILDKSSRQFPCPDCGNKRLVRYVDITTEEYIPDKYGRCNRRENCAYWLNPYKDGYSKMIWKQEQGHDVGQWKPANQTPKLKPAQKPVSFIPFEILKQTRQGWEQNTFIQNLLQRFKPKDIEKIIVLYQLGTICNGYRTGAVTFP